MTTGGSGITSGDQLIVTFAVPYSIVPVVIVTPTNEATVDLGPYANPTATGTGFTVGVAKKPKPSTSYTFAYFAIQ